MPRNARVEEYQSLRNEILKRQDARLIALGYCVTAVGAVIGLTLRGNPSGSAGFDQFGFAVISFAFLILVGALVITIHNTQQIDVLAQYIREVLEPQLELGWETWWAQHRRPQRLGASRSLALFYSLLSLGIYALAFATGLYLNPLFLILLTVLMLVSLVLCFDLFQRTTKEWAYKWNKAQTTEKN